MFNGTQYIVSLFENGRCAIFHKASHTTIFLNKNIDEQIKSIFYNRLNMSIIVVGVTKKDEYNSLKCRSVPISLINKAFKESTNKPIIKPPRPINANLVSLDY